MITQTEVKKAYPGLMEESINDLERLIEDYDSMLDWIDGRADEEPWDVRDHDNWVNMLETARDAIEVIRTLRKV